MENKKKGKQTKPKKFYAVVNGREGSKGKIFTEWNQCEKYVSGFAGNKFKSFNTEKEAESYLLEHLTELVPTAESIDPEEKKKADREDLIKSLKAATEQKEMEVINEDPESSPEVVITSTVTNYNTQPQATGEEEVMEVDRKTSDAENAEEEALILNETNQVFDTDEEGSPKKKGTQSEEDEEFEVDHFVECKMTSEGHHVYCVKWKGSPYKKGSKEAELREDQCGGCPELLKDYLRNG